MADLFGASTQQDLLSGGDGAKLYDWHFLNSANATQADVNSTVAGFYTVTPTSNALLSSGNTAMPFLYQNIVGDFDVDIPYYNEGDTFSFRVGLMARDPNASVGEDYVGIWRNHIRGSGEQTEWASCTNNSFANGTDSMLNAFTRITRVGNVFTLYAKVNSGDSWTQKVQYTRNDFASTIQLGIVTAYVSNGFVSYSKIGADSFNGTYTVNDGTTSTMALTFPSFTFSAQSDASSSTMALTVPNFTMSAYVDNPYRDLALIFPAFTFNATAIQGTTSTMALTVPSFSLNAETSPQITMDLLFPEFTFSAYSLAPGTSQMALKMPLFSFSANVLTGNKSSMDLLFPEFIFSAKYGDALNLQFPPFTFNAQGYSGNVSSGNLQFPPFTFNATGVSSPLITMDLQFPEFILDMQCATGTISTMALVMPEFSLSGNVAVGRTMSMDLLFPEFTFSAIASQGTISTMALIFPQFSFNSYVHNNEQSYLNSNIINVTTGANSVFTNFFFNSFCKFNGRYYGANQYGIFELGGENDDGTQIDARLRSGKYDFGITQLKSLPEVVIALNSRAFKFKTIIDQDKETEYTFNPDNDQQYYADTTRPIRVKLGKGTRSRYWETIVENVNGNNLEIETIELPIEIQSRKAYR
jgi:hypothetical protein